MHTTATPLLRFMLLLASGCILFAGSGCNSSPQVDTKDLWLQADNNLNKGLLRIDGHYRLDSGVILGNLNLAPLIKRMQAIELSEKKTPTEIPAFISSFLDSIQPGFALAGPGEEWQAGDVVISKSVSKKVYDPKQKDSVLVLTFDSTQPLPNRQLIYFGIGSDVALMTYYRGGWGKNVHALLFKFDNEHLLDFWCGILREEHSDKHKILNYLDSNKTKQWVLNSNIVQM